MPKPACNLHVSTLSFCETKVLGSQRLNHAVIMRFFYLLLLAVGLPFFGKAQQEKCLTTAVMQEHLQRYPELAAQRAALSAQMKAFETDLQNGATERAVVTIPVVVHVVYKSPFDNISDAQIQSQIDVLNRDFRKQNDEIADVPLIFTGLTADVEFQFCLAQLDPAGQPTNGITRKQTDYSNIGILVAPDGRGRVHYDDLGGTYAWNPNQYLNIWVARIGGGILGYATPPGTAPIAEDGVVVDPQYFGTVGTAANSFPNHLGRTATHEVGHYFNLFHIWGNGFDSCFDDDDVDDTPVQRNPFSGCPSHPQTSCGTTSMFMNFMDYTDDPCMAMFTLGQKSRMTAALFTARPGLLASSVCTFVSAGEANPGPAMKLYPNPVSRELFVELPGGFSQYTATVTDMQGKTWETTQVLPNNNAETMVLEVSALPAGVYCLQLDNGSRRYSLKFVKL
jgi:hypothetical protein